jgi:hypothetical protein
MPIERFIWTYHAEKRLNERRLPRAEVERTIRDGHAGRRINRGRADWLVQGLLADGRHFVAIYDHAHGADGGAVRIVSLWPL